VKSGGSSFFRPLRFYILLAIFVVVILALLFRMFYLTVIERHFLVNQSNIRTIRVVTTPAYRGMMLDRNDRRLALSTPVDSVWVNPHVFESTPENIFQLSQILQLSPKNVGAQLKQNADKYFLYIKRNVPDDVVDQVKALNIPGVYFKQSYQRYYPEADATSQLLGFTNVDNKGQDGLELAFNSMLQGHSGKEKVLKDRLGQTVAVLDMLKQAKSGKNVTLSIDTRLQYLAYHTLMDTVNEYDADSGSVIIMDPRNGEILSMANAPSYDPNNRTGSPNASYRNRAVTDMYEPGSTMKTFSIASALSTGKFTPDSKIDTTSNGVYRVGHHLVRDDTRNGVITVTKILQISSNIGATKLTLASPPDQLLSFLHKMGFAQKPGGEFPGQSPGVIPHYRKWSDFELATLAFGYGIDATPLQLARAYSAIANQGRQCPITVLKRTQPPVCPQIMNPHLADQMLTMLQSVLQAGGTGTLARVKGYQVAGKTGTSYIAKPGGGYYKDEYNSSFVAIAPASNPQLEVLVLIRNPHHQHFGAIVAAPAVQKILSGALRILNIPPDDLSASK
jgi:cell division protein FtsI (penicillin-binding protein 3)